MPTKAPFEVMGEALERYWTNPLPLIVLFTCLACIGTLLYVFMTNARNAKLRVSLLTGLYSLSIFFWLFFATSLVLCLSVASIVGHRGWGIRAEVGGGVSVRIDPLALVSVGAATTW